MQALKFSRRSFLKSGAAAATMAALPHGLPSAAAASFSLSSLCDTQFGPVQGKQEGAHFVWHGIPYGAAPVGEARWTAPQDPAAWSGAKDCTASGPAAYQYTTCALGTEDCLKLNIFSPVKAKKAPVLVYLHSGGNQIGSSQELSGGETAEALGCVFVGVEYRLGLFGWNCLPAFCPAPEDTGNFALLDIAKALDWVKENIASFGGDPQNVTLFGFSAGGRDVLALLASPLAEGRFQKAVSCSGGITFADPDTSASRLADVLAPLAVQDGKCSTEAAAQNWLLTSDSAVRDWLCGVDAARLSAVMVNAALRMDRFPHLYADGVILPRSTDAVHFASVPLLLLTGATEFSAFARWDPYFSSDAMRTLSTAEQEAAKQFAVTYGSALYRVFNAEQTAETLVGSSPLYLAQANYGAFGTAHEIPLLGSFHGIFLPMLSSDNAYAAWADFSNAGFTAMAGQFRTFLKNFLTCDDPNGKKPLSSAPKWTAWTAQAPVCLTLDAAADKADIQMQSLPSAAESFETILHDMRADTSVSDSIKQQVLDHVLRGRFFSAALDGFTIL